MQQTYFFNYCISAKLGRKLRQNKINQFVGAKVQKVVEFFSL
jgi:hypothetical protein